MPQTRSASPASSPKTPEARSLAAAILPDSQLHSEADPAVYACPDGADCQDPECQAENARRASLAAYPLEVTMQAHRFSDPYGMLLSFRMRQDGTAALAYSKSGGFERVRNPFVLALLREALGIA